MGGEIRKREICDREIDDYRGARGGGGRLGRLLGAGEKFFFFLL